MDEKKVAIVDAMSNKGESFSAFMAKVGPVLMNDPRIKEIIDKYESHTPGGGEILKRFIVSEGAFTIFEAAQRRKNDDAQCNQDWNLAFKNRGVTSDKIKAEEAIIKSCTEKITELKSVKPTDELHKKQIKTNIEELKAQITEATKKIKPLTEIKKAQSEKMDRLEPHRVEVKNSIDTIVKAARTEALEYRKGNEAPRPETRAKL